MCVAAPARMQPSASVVLVLHAHQAECAGAIQGFLAGPEFRSRRLAFVTVSLLARMRLQRAIGSRTAQVFTDPAEAQAWVLAKDPANQAA